MSEKIRCIPDKFLQKAEEFGGSDIEEWINYRRDEAAIYFDKPDHFARSLSNQPNHQRKGVEIFAARLNLKRRNEGPTSPFIKPPQKQYPPLKSHRQPNHRNNRSGEKR